MATLNFKDFKGMNFEEEMWQQNCAKYMTGLDCFGLQDNTLHQSIPGVLQGTLLPSAGTEAAAPNDITDLIRSFVTYSSEVWGLSDITRLYKRASGTWTLQRSTAGGDLTSTSGGGGLAIFAGSLWTSQNSRISRWDGAVWTQAFGTFTTGGVTARPMKQFSGKLFIGNDRYISSIDSTPTFTANSLTLPSEFTIKHMEVFGNFIYIFADNGVFSRLFLWDGSSTTFNSFFDLYQESSAPHIIFNEGVLWAVATRGISTGTPIYTFTGSSFQKMFMLPIGVFNNMDNILSTYNGGLLIGSTNTGNALYQSGVGGVWMINRYNNENKFDAVIAFVVSGGLTATQIGAVYTSGTAIYVSTFNSTSSAYEVWEIGGNTTEYNGGIWQSLPIDAGDASKLKIWHGIQLDSELSTGSGSVPSIQIGYRLDYASTFTTLKTISFNSSDFNQYVPIGRVGKVIELQFTFNTANPGRTTRLHGYQLDYSPVQL